MPEFFKLKRQSNAAGAETFIWVDLDGRTTDSVEWLKNGSGLPEQVIMRLLDESTLNHHEKFDDGLLLRFQTQVVSPAIGKSDSTSVGLWFERDRVISICSAPIPEIETLKTNVSKHQSSWAPLEILTCLINSNVSKLESLIVMVSERTDDLEEQILESIDDANSAQLDLVRRKTIRIRRQLLTLRNLLVFILSDHSLPISEDDRPAIESVTDRVRNYLEILEGCHERAHLLRDQIESQMNARLNQITYNLTIVATVFLPLSFLTGLLGMNVSGIPEQHDPQGFVVVCTSMVLIAISSWIYLRWRKWV
ncbi:Zinc transport protein ZntB [Novipirellula aureliae]|uniref:Zinc transport protein ZntB n=1 Tax=Novipirellula aureliae TaxID=2527966 RepID=A0A5C6E8N6_9BACT|nr:CorA family divalent cation transporter [Novipirellula aureliae]TWU43796.1 Zinc transport protein ZntB [Novipirellula aureliae]